MVEICQLNIESDTKQTYLKGINLLNSLFKQADKMTPNTPNYSLILHLFLKSMNPFLSYDWEKFILNINRWSKFIFLSFIESWIFHGEFIDPFDEFLIDLNYNWLYSRGIIILFKKT